MKIRNVFAVVTLIVGAVLFSNCDGEGTGGLIDENPDTEVLSIESNEVLPGQAVKISSSKDLLNESYIALFGDSSVTITKVNDSNDLYFIVPVLASGNYRLEIDDQDLKESLDFMISNYTPIADAQKIVDDYSINLKTAVSGLKDLNNEGWNIDAENIALIESLNTQFEAELSKMNQAEKEQLAYFIQSNGLSDFHTPTIRFNDSLYRSTTPVEELTKLKIEFVVTMGTTVSLIGTFANLLAIPEGFFTKAAALVTAGLLVHEIVQLLEIADRIGWLAAIPNLFGSKLETLIVNGNEDVVFEAKIPKVITSEMEFRAMMKGDEKSRESFLSQFAISVEEFNIMWYKANVFINKFKSIFGVNVKEIKGKPKSLPSNPRKLKQYPDPLNLKIENISDPYVQMTDTFDDDGLKVIVEADKETDFTFDLVYKEDKFDEVRKTYTATVKAAEFKIEGKWLWHQGSSTQIKFECDTTGRMFNAFRNYPDQNNNWEPISPENFKFRLEFNPWSLSLMIYELPYNSSYVGFGVKDVNDTEFQSSWEGHRLKRL